MTKLIATFSMLACAAMAQSPAAIPTFEVASVKVAAPPDAGRGGPGGGAVRIARGCGKPDPAMVRCNATTLRGLLMRAYDVKSYQVQGPTWMDSDTYDVTAKIPDGTPADQVPAMLQALLAERFGMKLHKETRTLPAFELSIGKGGPKLKEVDVDKLPQIPAPGSAPPPPPPRGPDGAPQVSAMPAGAIMMRISSNGARTVRGNMTIAQLINHLVQSFSRPVADLTNLKGTYEIDLTYLADESDGLTAAFAQVAGAGGAAGAGGNSAERPAQDATTPVATLTQALQQTLGLKLESKKAPVDMLIIDSANKVPTEN